ncbi:unnamed protein product [Phyllotreta striolata]|uniref:Uncharacterized protein n=1 Tax=Phyllotreta striolata TaxID=444603 RepID=A0A9P0DS82_PHYSR|nr:unnamed protein product [Phyllotreta striolata]
MVIILISTPVQKMFSTPRLTMDGEGDGIKNTRKLATMSEKKMRARKIFEENKPTMTGEQKRARFCLSKSMSVAEITPTRSKPRRKPTPKLEQLDLSGLSGASSDDNPLAVVLHATPRRPAAASRRCSRDWAACKVYGRLLLCVWRRYGARLRALSDSNGSQQNQISQLELQVDFLKNMRNSECDKRNEALAECVKLKRKIELLELEKDDLNETIKRNRDELEEVKGHLRYAEMDANKYSERLKNAKEQLKKRKDEKQELLVNLGNHVDEIHEQKSIIIDLEAALKIAEKNLRNAESNLLVKENECDQLSRNLESKSKANVSLKNEINDLQNLIAELRNRSEQFEDELRCCAAHMEELKDENRGAQDELARLRTDLSTERKKYWSGSKKGLALLSLTALQKLAEVVLLVYHEY